MFYYLYIQYFVNIVLKSVKVVNKFKIFNSFLIYPLKVCFSLLCVIPLPPKSFHLVMLRGLAYNTLGPVGSCHVAPSPAPLGVVCVCGGRENDDPNHPLEWSLVRGHSSG